MLRVGKRDGSGEIAALAGFRVSVNYARSPVVAVDGPGMELMEVQMLRLEVVAPILPPLSLIRSFAHSPARVGLRLPYR